jgi:MoaA/NifB/PqqE/SkfB family radical SAM enzyme
MSVKHAYERRDARELRMRGIGEGRALVGPQTVHVDLANGCNTNCTTCWDHSPLLDAPRTTAWKRAVMPFETFRDLAADLASMRSVEAVILSGMGDPFVNPDVYRVVEAAKGHGWHVTILTNALLADPVRVLALDVDMLLVSVNGVTPASYTAFHPNLTARDFDRLRDLLGAFARAGKRFKHVQVINRDTAPELVETVTFARRFDAAHVTYKLASLGRGTEACAVTDEQRVRLLDEWIPEARREAERLAVATNLDVFETQVRAGGLATAPVADVGCFMGWSYARVTVDGRILFCCSTEVEVGRLDAGPFSEQWYGATWTATRERLMRGEYFASCAQCGKLNQNVKIGRKVRDRYGEALFLARTGRGGRTP